MWEGGRDVYLSEMIYVSSIEKFDGVVAAIMGLDRAIRFGSRLRH